MWSDGGLCGEEKRVEHPTMALKGLREKGIESDLFYMSVERLRGSRDSPRFYRNFYSFPKFLSDTKQLELYNWDKWKAKLFVVSARKVPLRVEIKAARPGNPLPAWFLLGRKFLFPSFSLLRTIQLSRTHRVDAFAFAHRSGMFIKMLIKDEW